MNSDDAKVASFFAGIGGFDLGFERAGAEIVWQCEVNRFCLDVLAEHWPDVPRADDITKLSGSDVPDADIWAGGFPCQDISVARMSSKRKGLYGSQSGLFFDFARLIGERRPKAVLIENVAGLLSSNQGRDFATVVRTLADFGYGVAWRVLDSRYFGVPQSRKRVFICGVDGDPEAAASVFFEPECGDRDSEKSRPHGTEAVPSFKKIIGDPERGYAKELAHCVYAEGPRHTGTDWSRNYVAYPDDGQVRRLTPAESERLQGFPAGWTELPGGSDDSKRYHAVGNAVTVPVIEWIARRILCVLGKTSSESRFSVEEGVEAAEVVA